MMCIDLIVSVVMVRLQRLQRKWNFIEIMVFKRRRMRASLFTWVAHQTNYFFEHKTWNDFFWFLSNGYFKSSNELNYQNVQHLNYSIIWLKCFEPVQQPWSYGDNTTRPFIGFNAFQTLFQKIKYRRWFFPWEKKIGNYLLWLLTIR